MKVAVVGGAGFLGSHVVDLLVKREHEVVVVDDLSTGDSRNVNEKAEWFRRRIGEVEFAGDVDVVVNCATLPMESGISWPNGCWHGNVNPVLELLLALRQGVYRRLVQVSSSSVYGPAESSQAVDESFLVAPQNIYGAAKAAGDALCIANSMAFGLDVSILRLFNLYGPRQSTKKYLGLIPATIKALMKGESPVVHGSGEQARDYLFVRDAADLVVRRVESAFDGSVVLNGGSGWLYSVKDVVKDCCEFFDHSNAHPVFVGQRELFNPTGAIRADWSRANKHLGWSPTTTFKDGIKETVKWYRENSR